MYVLFIVLNEAKYLDDILRKFVELGVTGATIIDSQGMAGAIINNFDENTSLFGSLRTLMEGAKPYNKTIFSVIKTEELVDKTVSAVREIMKDINQPGVGFMFTIPIANVYRINSDN